MKDLTRTEKCGMLNKQEEALLKILRDIKYGQVVVYMDSGQPIRIEKITESIKL